MPTTESITLIERYGSFGLLVVIVLAALVGAGLVLRYLKNELLPKVFAHLEAERAEREKMCDATDRAITELEKNTKNVADLTTEVRKLKDRTDEHRPVRRLEGDE